MIYHHDFLALEDVEPANLARDIVDDARGLAVGMEQQRKHIGESATVGRGRHSGTSFEAFRDLDSALNFILRLTLGPGQLDAVDAAVTRVDEVQIVDEAAEKAGAARSVVAFAIALQWEELFVGQRRRDSQRAERYGAGKRRFFSR